MRGSLFYPRGFFMHGIHPRIGIALLFFGFTLFLNRVDQGLGLYLIYRRQILPDRGWYR